MAQKIRLFTQNTERHILQLWSLALLLILGLLTSLPGCKQDTTSLEYKLLHPTIQPGGWYGLDYGVQPMYGVYPLYGAPVPNDNTTQSQ